jgi:hypothetical protein
VGDIPFENMIGNAKQIVAGVVQDVVNTDGQSLLTIQAGKTYKGTAATTITATAPRLLTTNEIQSLRSKTGIVMLDAKGVLLRPTSTMFVTDFIVAVPDGLAQIENADAALCIDWMRGLLNRGGISIMQGLGFAATYCGAPQRAEPIRRHLGESKKTGDALLNMLVGLAYGDPDALRALEQRLVTEQNLPYFLVDNITWAMIFYTSPDERGAYTLERLALGAKSGLIQDAAAGVLANIHSDETWPHLVALLDSPFLYVRHHAVKGLEDNVYAGERSGELAFGEKPLTHLGQPVKRNARKRPPVPDNIRGLFMQPERNDATLVAFWRDYMSKN